MNTNSILIEFRAKASLKMIAEENSITFDKKLFDYIVLLLMTSHKILLLLIIDENITTLQQKKKLQILMNSYILCTLSIFTTIVVFL